MCVETLKRLKKQSKMTTAEIAEKSGIPEPTLEKLFAGKTKRPTLQTVTKLAHLFGCTLDDLQGDASNPNEKAPEVGNPATEAEMYGYLKQIESLLVAKGYINEGEDISEADADFLIAILDLIDAHFKKRK